MAILEKEVQVGLANKNIKYFEHKGYNIPRVNGKNGNLVVVVGYKISIKVDDLFDSSDVKVTKICDICEKITKNQPYSAIVKSRKLTDGRDRCSECGNLYSNESQVNNVKYEKTFESKAIELNKQFLLDEFSDRNESNPREISYGSQKKYWWICPIYGKEHEYDMIIKNRIRKGQNCPYCSNQRVNHTNCLWTTHPEVAKLLKDKVIGFKVTYGCNKKFLFVCPDCSLETKPKNLSSVVRQGLACHRCSDGISYPEKFLFSALNQVNIDIDPRKVFEWSKDYRHKNISLCGEKEYDIFIPSSKTIIEIHGIQHYERSFERTGARTLEEEQENDEIKKNMALHNGIKNYIVIDAKKSEMNYIKSSILSSDLQFIANLSNVDWLKCHEFACHSLVVEVCNLWMNGYKDASMIAEKLKLGFSTVKKYVKQGSILGWCDYKPEDGIEKSARLPERKVVKLSMGGEYIQEYSSISEASRLSNTNIAAISRVCKISNNSSSAGGFRWMYKEEYEMNSDKLQPYKRRRNNKQIVRLGIDNTFIDEFESAEDARRRLSISGSHISSVCHGIREKAGGFKWMFKEDYDKLKRCD